jgi:hypothetical protein
MKILYHAYTEDALRNGSFVRQRSGPRTNELIRYMNGDYVGEISILPNELTTWSEKDAKRLLPKCCGGKGVA